MQSPSSVNANFWFNFHRLKPASALQILLALCPEQTTVGPKAVNSEYCFQPERTNWKGNIYILSPAYSDTLVQTWSVYGKATQIWNQDPNRVSLLLQDITQHLFGTV